MLTAGGAERFAWSPQLRESMATTPNDPQAKAMEREVNRLLAQLTYAGAEPIGELRPNGGPPPVQPVSRPRSSGPARAIVANPRWNVAALWGRALLTTALGVAMIQWPYPQP